LQKFGSRSITIADFRKALELFDPVSEKELRQIAIVN
jgi:hypothetical protein